MYKLTVQIGTENHIYDKEVKLFESRFDAELETADWASEVSYNKRTDPNYKAELYHEIVNVDSEQDEILAMKEAAAYKDYEILTGVYVDDYYNTWWMATIPQGEEATRTVMIHPEIGETREETERVDKSFYDFKTEYEAVKTAYDHIMEATNAR